SCPFSEGYWREVRSSLPLDEAASARPPLPDCRGPTSQDPIGGAGRPARGLTACRYLFLGQPNRRREKGPHGHSAAGPGPKAYGTGLGPSRTGPPCVPFPGRWADSRELRRSPGSRLLSLRDLSDPFSLLIHILPVPSIESNELKFAL